VDNLFAINDAASGRESRLFLRFLITQRYPCSGNGRSLGHRGMQSVREGLDGVV